MLFCYGTNKADPRQRRLLHHISKLTSQINFSFARHDVNFDLQRIAAHTGPGQSSDNTDLVCLSYLIFGIFHLSEKMFQILFCHPNRFFLICLEDFSCRLSADLPDLPLQIPDSRFPRIAGDHLPQGIIRNIQLPHGKSVFFKLFL